MALRTRNMTMTTIPFFVVFLPVLLLLYYVFSFSSIAQSVVLFAGCIVFYASGEPSYVILMVFMVLINALFSYMISSRDKASGKPLVWIGCAINLLVLIVYRYMGFLLQMLGAATNIRFRYNVTPPFGIAVFTLHAISYLIDVYNRKAEATTPFNVGIFCCFFPFLSHGPVMRYHEMASQMHKRHLDVRLLAMGICRFVVGMGKVLILADCFEGIADNVFSLSQVGISEYTVPAALAWLGIGAFLLQVYFQLGGFSDMAIGLAMTFGYVVPENIIYPYSAITVTDYWTRWELGAQNWFNEYIKGPLGGDEETTDNPNIVAQVAHWVCFGAWHGPGYTFLLWGAYHFIVLIVEQFFDLNKKMPFKWLGRIYTLFMVAMGFVLFRATDIYQASRYYMNLFGANHNGFHSDLAILLLKENWHLILVGILFSTPIARKFNEKMFKNPQGWQNAVATIVYPVCMFLLLVLCFCYMVTRAYYPTV